MIKEQKNLEKQLNKIIDIFKSSDAEIRPHFVLTGPSGTGKSHIIKALAIKQEVNFMEINAAQLTKEGTSGNSLSKALTPLLNYQNNLTICFVDEFDKLFISGNSNSDLAHETTNGVQNEFLKVLESDAASVFGDYGKYVDCSVNKVLFIFAGAFNGAEDVTLDDLREFGIKTEFLGRVGLVFNTTKLSLESMLLILGSSTLLKHYLNLFAGVKKKEVVSIIGEVIKENYEANTLGIRMINTLIHQYFIKGKDFNKTAAKKIVFQNTLKID